MNFAFILGFIFGFVTGIAIAVLIFVILAYFKIKIESRMTIVEKTLARSGPQQHGAILMPASDAEIARQKRIEENSAAGKDTPISELS
jgi:predicted small secreted protein